MSYIDKSVLAAMGDELQAMEKKAFPVAALGSLASKALPALGRLGGKVIGGAGRVAGAAGAKKGFGRAVGKGITAMGGGAAGSQRLRQAVGGATVGAGALGASALLGGKRPQPSGY